jgi:hypothetical protein
MASIAARSSPRRIATLVFALVCALGTVAAAESPIIVKKETRAGEAVLVRGFAEFDSGCHLKHVQRIIIAGPPSHGTVETRPGNVVIGPNWVGAGHCEGTTLRGVQVFYVPGPGFTGTDRFSLDVGYSRGRTVRADVEVQVR